MVAAPEYSVKTQAKLVHALCVLHNFIRIHDPDDLDQATEEVLTRPAPTPIPADFTQAISNEERTTAMDRRDRIAAEMWESYVAYTGRD